MALTLSAKDPQEVVRYAWAPALADGDGIASFTLTETGCTIDSEEIVGCEVVFFVSGGAAGTIGSIVATAVTNDGETLEDTLYLPIQASSLAFDDTAQDIVSFALRKVKGVRGTASAGEASDALERLNQMLAAWRLKGADVGAMLPLALVSRLYCEDAFLDAIKANLVLKLADLYGFQPAPTTIMEARQGIALIMNAKLDSGDYTRESTDYQ
jgi:hypothetical protein